MAKKLRKVHQQMMSTGTDFAPQVNQVGANGKKIRVQERKHTKTKPISQNGSMTS